MYMTVGLLNHNITFKAYVFGLGVPFFGNFSGTLIHALTPLLSLYLPFILLKVVYRQLIF